MNNETSSASSTTAAPAGSQLGIRNIDEPIRLTGVKISGVSAGASEARPDGGDRVVNIITRDAMTSDERRFHRIAENLGQFIETHARKVGKPVRLSRAGYVLLVIKPDHTAELWVDTAAVTEQILSRRALAARSVIFESDVADVLGVSFPCVAINPEDQVICLVRESWRFGLYFDFNSKVNLSTELMSRTLGRLIRQLRYAHLYDALADRAVYERLIKAGWFPFVEIVPHEFRSLSDACEAGFDLTQTEQELLAKFDAARMEHIYERWTGKPHFASRAPMLRSAIDNFLRGDPYAVSKIVLTEIEGILRDAHVAAHGKPAKLKTLLSFACTQAEQKAGATDTLLFPTAFADYLAQHTFVDFDPSAGDGSAQQRHAVGHGAATTESYTMIRALQILLTLDQFAFYT